MEVNQKVDENLQELAKQYAEKYPYPDEQEWIQFGEMVLFQNKLAEKDALNKLEAERNEQYRNGLKGE